MAKSKKPAVYVVVAVHWEYDRGLNKVNVRGEGDPCHPVRAFRDRAAAAAYAAKREASKRKAEYPFSYLMTTAERFSDVSTRSHEQVVAWLAANEFPVPGGTSGDQPLSEWWEVVSDGLTPERRNLLWDQFDKIRFFEVREVEFEG